MGGRIVSGSVGIASMLAATWLAMPAAAQTFPETIAPLGPGAQQHQRLDRDLDGKVSRKEAVGQQDITRRWTTLDVNRDGALDKAEFAAFEAEPPRDAAGAAKENSN